MRFTKVELKFLLHMLDNPNMVNHEPTREDAVNVSRAIGIVQAKLQEGAVDNRDGRLGDTKSLSDLAKIIISRNESE